VEESLLPLLEELPDELDELLSDVLTFSLESDDELLLDSLLSLDFLESEESDESEESLLPFSDGGLGRP